MNIITKESLYETQLRAILYGVYDDFLAEQSGVSFDDWLYKNLNLLGEKLYENIGDFYGDANAAAQELGL